MSKVTLAADSTPEAGAEPTMVPQTQAVMTCMVPAETVKVVMQIEMYNDTSNDFITFSLDEGDQKTVFYNQGEKGKVKESIDTGRLNMLVMSETMEQVDGVIKNVGLISLSKEDEAFTGFLAAKGNLYPLVCISLLPKKDAEKKALKKPKNATPASEDSVLDPVVPSTNLQAEFLKQIKLLKSQLK